MGEGSHDFEKPIRVLEQKIEDLEQVSQDSDIDLSDEIQRLRECLERQKRVTYANLSAWERVQLARDPERPVISDFIQLMLDEFIELHGDHKYQDDEAIVTGLARIEHQRMLFLGHRRGKNTQERMDCNFGSAHPEGYRKALDKMKLAEKFDLPVVSLINTPGAYPGIGAEERGQARAIARNLFEMSRLRTPIICIVTGEGGSGGAIGIGVGDCFSIMENAYYSVISPEGCGAILWKSGDKAPEAAEALKLTPTELKQHGIVDEIIPEPLGGAHRDPKGAADILKSTIMRYIEELSSCDIDDLVERRYEKYRNLGSFLEGKPAELKGQVAGHAMEEYELSRNGTPDTGSAPDKDEEHEDPSGASTDGSADAGENGSDETEEAEPGSAPSRDQSVQQTS